MAKPTLSADIYLKFARLARTTERVTADPILFPIEGEVDAGYWYDRVEDRGPVVPQGWEKLDLGVPPSNTGLVVEAFRNPDTNVIVVTGHQTRQDILGNRGYSETFDTYYTDKLPFTDLSGIRFPAYRNTDGTIDPNSPARQSIDHVKTNIDWLAEKYPDSYIAAAGAGQVGFATAGAAYEFRKDNSQSPVGDRVLETGVVNAPNGWSQGAFDSNAFNLRSNADLGSFDVDSILWGASPSAHEILIPNGPDAAASLGFLYPAKTGVDLLTGKAVEGFQIPASMGVTSGLAGRAINEGIAEGVDSAHQAAQPGHPENLDDFLSPWTEPASMANSLDTAGYRNLTPSELHAASQTTEFQETLQQQYREANPPPPSISEYEMPLVNPGDPAPDAPGPQDPGTIDGYHYVGGSYDGWYSTEPNTYFNQRDWTDRASPEKAAELNAERTRRIEYNQSLQSSNTGTPDASAVANYTIQSGDTLSAIAKRSGVTVDDLLDANPGITDPDMIRAGDGLNIPTGKRAEAEQAGNADESIASSAPIEPTEVTLPDGTQASVFLTSGEQTTFYSAETGKTYLVSADGTTREIPNEEAWGGEIVPASYTTESADGASLHRGPRLDPVGEEGTAAQPTPEAESSANESQQRSTKEQDAQTRAEVQALSSILTLYQAIQGGNNVAAAAAGASTVLAFDRLDGTATNTTVGWAAGLGAIAAGMNLDNALENGDNFGALVAGSNLVYQGATFTAAVTEGAVSQAASSVANGIGQYLGALGIAYSLSQGDTTGAVIAAVSIAFPVVGLILSVCSMLFAEEPPDVKGTAVATWDEHGNLTTKITEDEEGGGETANNALKGMLGTLEAILATQTDNTGEPLYAVVPQRLPSVSFFYRSEADLILNYTDDNGNPVSRHYDGSGNRTMAGFGEAQSLNEEFIEQTLSANAIVPRWEAETIRERMEQGDQDAWKLEDEGAGLPKETTDGLKQAFSVLVLDLDLEGCTPTPSVPREEGDGDKSATAPSLSRGPRLDPIDEANVRFDVDADGYLESTNWVAASQAMLVIDRDLDGSISKANEFLTLDEAAYDANARNSLRWLDANGDGILDGNDPAFGAVKLWLDINRDAISDANELIGLGELSITAIDFTSQPPVLIDSDGGCTDLAEEHLTAGTAGARVTYEVDVSQTAATIADHADANDDTPAGAAALWGTTVESPSVAAAMVELEENPQGGQKGRVFMHYTGIGTGRVRSASMADAREEARQVRAGMEEAAGGVFAGTAGVLTGMAVASTASAGQITGGGFTVPELPDTEYLIAFAEKAARAYEEHRAANALETAGPDATAATGAPPVTAGPDGIADAAGVRCAIPDATTTVYLREHEAFGDVPEFPQDGSASSRPTFRAPDLLGELVAEGEDNNQIHLGPRDLMFYTYSQGELLGNDSSPNGGAVLSITGVGDADHGSVLLVDGHVCFYPDRDYYGPASFSYTVSDQWGYSAQAFVAIDIAPVNDPPVIEAIEYGRPIFGYGYITHREYSDTGWIIGGWQYDPNINRWYRDVTTLDEIRNEATATSLAEAGGLRNSAGNLVTPSYYQSGRLRPVAFDNIDATQTYSTGGSGDGDMGSSYTVPVNDPMRQNGRIIAYDIDSDIDGITFGIGSEPGHGYAAANRYVPANVSTWPDMPSELLMGRAVTEGGAWQYQSRLYDGYSGSDPFTVVATDAGGGVSQAATVYATHHGTSQGGGGGCCPVVIDLDNDGLELVAPDDSAVFADVNGDGWKEHIGWVGKDDALLALDDNCDGRVDTVAFADRDPQARTDLEGLRAFDSDGDGVLTCADTDWHKFGLFEDRNGDGIQDDGEFKSLDDAGIERIGLLGNGQVRVVQGNVVFGESVVTRTDGTTTRAGDVMFAGENTPWPSAATRAVAAASDAEVARAATAFLEAVATASAADTPLGFVASADLMGDMTAVAPTMPAVADTTMAPA